MLSSVEQAFVGRDENELPEERLRGSEFAAFFRRCCLLVFQGGRLFEDRGAPRWHQIAIYFTQALLNNI